MKRTQNKMISVHVNKDNNLQDLHSRIWRLEGGKYAFERRLLFLKLRLKTLSSHCVKPGIPAFNHKEP